MDNEQETWRMSLKEPPPPYVDKEPKNESPPVSPIVSRRPRWSISSSSSRKSSISKEESAWKFTAAYLDSKLSAQDQKFAKVILQMMAAKLEQGHLSYMHGGGWGYTWTQGTADNPDYRTCELDRSLGFSAFAYRKRFRKVEELAVQELFRRGFDVKYFEICVTDLSIGKVFIGLTKRL